MSSTDWQAVLRDPRVQQMSYSVLAGFVIGGVSGINYGYRTGVASANLLLNERLTVLKAQNLKANVKEVPIGEIVFNYCLFLTFIHQKTNLCCVQLTLLRNRHVARHVVRQASRFSSQCAMFGLAYSGIDSALAYTRGKDDVANPSISGAVVGTFIGRRLYGNDYRFADQ
jgi:hypothetical protein